REGALNGFQLVSAELSRSKDLSNFRSACTSPVRFRFRVCVCWLLIRRLLVSVPLEFLPSGQKLLYGLLGIIGRISKDRLDRISLLISASLGCRLVGIKDVCRGNNALAGYVANLILLFGR